MEEIRGGPDNGPGGVNRNRWWGYVTTGRDTYDPEVGLADDDVPGTTQFDESRQARDKRRLFGKKIRSDTITNENTVPFYVASLGEEFYGKQTWVDKSAPHKGPLEFQEFLTGEGSYLSSISNKICPWPTTFMPRQRNWALKMSVMFDGLELVCRTKASLHNLKDRLGDGSVAYFCELCGNVLVPNHSVFVYCYLYDNKATQFVRSKWPNSFLRVCYIHFIIHGIDNGRDMFERTGGGGQSEGLRQFMFRGGSQ